MVIFGMIVLICGLFVAVSGWYNNMEVKSLGAGIFGMISGVCLMFSEDLSMVLFGIIGTVAFVAITIFILTERHNKNKSKRDKRREAIGGTNLDKFFVECVLAETNDFSKEKNIKKSQLLADKYNLKYPNGIEALYKQGFDTHKTVSQRFITNRLENLRAEEQSEFERLNKYSDLSGKNKRIVMLMDVAEELRKEAKRKKRSADMIMQSGLQKERNWATWGGAASGIAGVGAGIATAVDIQQKNMQISASNDRHRRAVMPAYVALTSSARGKNVSADDIMKEIEDFKLKLISKESAENLIKEITFDSTDVVVSETGAVKICTVASLNPDFSIFDDVEAVIDGTVIAKIYDGSNLCGTAKMVFPIYGLRRTAKLEGICIGCCEPGKKYTVKFVAKNLWAMEA